MNPNRRLPCSLVKRSAMNDQNNATANKLNTLTQTKKTRATITVANASGQQQPEQGQVGDEKVVDHGNEARPRHSGDQRTIERLRHEQRHEGSSEHPW